MVRGSRYWSLKYSIQANDRTSGFLPLPYQANEVPPEVVAIGPPMVTPTGCADTLTNSEKAALHAPLVIMYACLAKQPVAPTMSSNPTSSKPPCTLQHHVGPLPLRSRADVRAGQGGQAMLLHVAGVPGLVRLHLRALPLALLHCPNGAQRVQWRAAHADQVSRRQAPGDHLLVRRPGQVGQGDAGLAALGVI